MSPPIVAPYGSWRSPITGEMVGRSAVELSEPWPEGDATYWREGRPAEGGRGVVVRRDREGPPIDVTPEGFNVRTKVHEYGGGSYWVHDGVVFFTNFEDQRIYRQEPSGEPRPITPDPPSPGSVRYADGRATPDGRFIICVRERHEGRSAKEKVNELVALRADGSLTPRIIAEGHDFYSFPRISTDGRFLAWTCWDHPQMPWDGTELWVAELSSDARPGDARRVGGGHAESIFQPEWSPDGFLHFVSDRTGWWNLYRERDRSIEALHERYAEFGVPQWLFGYSTYAILSDGRIACISSADGVDRLEVLDPSTSEMVEAELPFTSYTDRPYVRSEGSRVVAVAGSATMPHGLISLDIATGAADVLRESERVTFDSGFVSQPRPIEFPTGEAQTAHALFYPPANPDFIGPDGERPPLIVRSHGGPTAQVTAEWDIEKQFFTSRGLAVVDVNYRGSTGYGREYRDRLKGQWGVVDTIDCISAARHLTEADEIDGARLAIRGGSAGGYTTLCALTFHDDFAVGASYFGIADLEPFSDDTHKFESRYLDSLVGPWPEAADVWRARSPVRFAEKLSCPVILFQGLEDEVVPPEQAKIMVRALQRKGLPHAYVAFEGEQHGFRKAESIRRALEAELYFYSRTLGFELADPVEPVVIENL